MAYAGTHNHLGRISAYAADTDDGYRRIAEMLKHLLPDQHPRSFLPIFHSISI